MWAQSIIAGQKNNWLQEKYAASTHMWELYVFNVAKYRYASWFSVFCNFTEQ